MELFFNDSFWSSELGLQSKLRANPAPAGPGASSRFLPHSASVASAPRRGLRPQTQSRYF